MRSNVADPGKVTLAAGGEGGCREIRDKGQEQTKELKASEKTLWTLHDNPPAKK